MAPIMAILVPAAAQSLDPSRCSQYTLLSRIFLPDHLDAGCRRMFLPDD
jgi:hypothetical protein